jgi:hypothetical protein
MNIKHVGSFMSQLTQSPDGVMWAGADKQALDAIFKEVFEEGVAEGVNNKNPLRDLIKTERVPFRGREIVRLSHTSRNVSPMFVGEDSAFADAGNQGYSRMFVDQRKLMSRLRMTWEVMQDSTSNEGAFISARKSEMQYLIDDMARRDEYALNSEGRGVLAVGNSGTYNTTTLTLKNPGGITNTNFGNRFLSTGMFIGAVDPNTGNLRTSIRKVTATASGGTSVTLDSSTQTGWADGDYIVQAANTSTSDVLDTSYEHAWWGVMALVDDGTYRASYYGLDRASVPAYSSYVTASTGALSTDIIQRVSDVVDQKLNGKINMMLAHHSTRRLIIQLTDADRRYMGASLLKPEPATAAFKQGDIPFGDVPVRALRDFPLDVLMFLDLTNAGFREYVSEPGKWVDEDGSVLWRVGTGSTGRDSFEAWYRMRKQYFLEYPAFCARLDGITGQSLVVQRAAGS